VSALRSATQPASAQWRFVVRQARTQQLTIQASATRRKSDGSIQPSILTKLALTIRSLPQLCYC